MRGKQWSHIIIYNSKSNYTVIQKECTQATRWLNYTKETKHWKCCVATATAAGNYYFRGDEKCVEGF